MTTTVAFPVVTGPIGPGYYMQFAQSAGPVPNDDFVVCIISDHAIGTTLSACSRVCRGSLYPDELMGIREVEYPTVSSAWHQDRMIGGAYGLTAPGASVDLYVVWLHANGTFVDAQTYTGWTWDPVTGASELAVRLFGGQTGASGDSAQILAAVRLVKTTPGQV